MRHARSLAVQSGAGRGQPRPGRRRAAGADRCLARLHERDLRGQRARSRAAARRGWPTGCCWRACVWLELRVELAEARRCARRRRAALPSRAGRRAPAPRRARGGGGACRSSDAAHDALPTGLAVGLARRLSRYTAIRPRFAPRDCWVPRFPGICRELGAPRTVSTDVYAPGVAGSDACDQIIARVRATPPGFVRTYGDVSPGAPRVAGAVLHACDDPTVPWHRIVRADGSLAKGARQRALLEPRACRSAARASTCASRAPAERCDVDPARDPRSRRGHAAFTSSRARCSTALPELERLEVGLLHLLIQHTSASLALNENASPDVRRDFETWFDRGRARAARRTGPTRSRAPTTCRRTSRRRCSGRR